MFIPPQHSTLNCLSDLQLLSGIYSSIQSGQHSDLNPKRLQNEHFQRQGCLSTFLENF